MANGGLAPTPTPQFPTHNAPRVWLLTSGDSPIGISVARQVLDHGDYVVSGIIQAEFEHESLRSQEFKDFLSEVVRMNGWKDRLKIVPLDIRYEAFNLSLLSIKSAQSVDLAIGLLGNARQPLQKPCILSRKSTFFSAVPAKQ